jgi:IS30 family transposase
MTKKYNQLTLEQRYKIETLISMGMTQSSIAEFIGVHRSTISREIWRNVPQRGIGAKIYVAINADDKTRQRHKSKKKCKRFTDDLKKQMKEWMIQKSTVRSLYLHNGQKIRLLVLVMKPSISSFGIVNTPTSEKTESTRICINSLNMVDVSESEEIIKIRGD